MAKAGLTAMTLRGISRSVLAAAALMLVSVGVVNAQSPARTEFEIKAAYLFTFGRFVEWPPRPARDDAGFTICVLGTDPFGAALDSTLADGLMHGKKVVAKRIAKPEDANACHILFISASEERRLTAIVQSLNQTDVLTVSDIPEFAMRGGMIQFVATGNRVRFEINLTSAREAGLTMSSELLRVASAVRKNPPGE